MEDFFIYERDLFRKIEDVFTVDDVVERDIKKQDEYGVVFNAMLFDEYDGGGLQGFSKDAEVIPVKVEIKVSYK